MSGPIDAINVTSHTWKGVGWPSWAPSSKTNIEGTVTVTTTALRAPALVRNKPRKDGTRPMSAWHKQWFRGVTPLWSWRIRENPSSWPDAWNWDYTLMPAIDELPRTTHPGLYWEHVNNVFPFPSSLRFSTDQVARTKVLNKIAQKKWDLGVTALEIKQTAGLITDLSVGIVSHVSSLIESRRAMRQKLDRFFREVRKHDDFYRAASDVGLKDLSLLEDLRSRWMQYQFGIRPLIRDVDDAVTWLSEAIHNHGYSVLVSAKAGHEMRDNRLLGSVMGTPARTSMETRLEVQDVCMTHYSVVYEIPTGQVSVRTALGLDNPFYVGWEVVRLSWMCDYVVGVGDWLQSFTAANGMVFREGCRSVLQRLTSQAAHYKPIGTIGPGGDCTFDKAPPQRGVYIERGDFNRELLVHGVTPAVVPQVKSELGLVQLANSLLALSSVLGGSPGLR